MNPGGMVLTVIPSGPELEGQCLGEADHTGLGRHIVGHEGLAAVGARGRDVDDATPSLLDHVRHHGLAAVEGPGQVDRQDAVPLLGGDLEERFEAVEAGAVDQDGGTAEPFPDIERRRCRSAPGRSRRRSGRRRYRRPPTILAAAASADPPSRSKMATACPSAASRSLMARPIPDPPPVTMAVRWAVIGSARPRGGSSGACRGGRRRRTGMPGAAPRGCPR